MSITYQSLEKNDHLTDISRLCVHVYGTCKKEGLYTIHCTELILGVGWSNIAPMHRDTKFDDIWIDTHNH